MSACNEVVRWPIRNEKVRGFQPPYRTVYIYRCSHGHETRMFASSFIGKRPHPTLGGIRCNHERTVNPNPREYHPHRADGLDRNLRIINQADFEAGCRCTCQDCLAKYEDSRAALRLWGGDDVQK